MWYIELCVDWIPDTCANDLVLKIFHEIKRAIKSLLYVGSLYRSLLILNQNRSSYLIKCQVSVFLNGIFPGSYSHWRVWDFFG